MGEAVRATAQVIDERHVIDPLFFEAVTGVLLCAEVSLRIWSKGPQEVAGVGIHAKRDIQSRAWIWPRHIGKQDFTRDHIDGEVSNDLSHGLPISEVVLSQLSDVNPHRVFANDGRAGHQCASAGVDGDGAGRIGTKRCQGAVAIVPVHIREWGSRGRIGRGRRKTTSNEDVTNGIQQAVTVGVCRQVEELERLTLADIGLRQLCETRR